MANKTSLSPRLKETGRILKTKVSDLSEELFNISEDLIEGSIETGQKVQDILEKALKEGNSLFAKQQNFTIETLEAVVKQYKTGQGRFNKLMGIQTIKAKNKAKAVKAEKMSKKAKTVKQTVRKSTSIDEMLENAIKSERISPLTNTKTLIK